MMQDQQAAIIQRLETIVDNVVDDSNPEEAMEFLAKLNNMVGVFIAEQMEVDSRLFVQGAGFEITSSYHQTENVQVHVLDGHADEGVVGILLLATGVSENADILDPTVLDRQLTEVETLLLKKKEDKDAESQTRTDQSDAVKGSTNPKPTKRTKRTVPKD